MLVSVRFSGDLLGLLAPQLSAWSRSLQDRAVSNLVGLRLLRKWANVLKSPN